MKTIDLNGKATTIVDDEDYERFKDFKWYYNKGSGYAFRNEYIKYLTKKTHYLHREILGATGRHIDVDHINRDKLDNRKQNIRLVTRAENLQNRAMYEEGKPVGAHHQDNMIGSLIFFGGKTRWLGYWKTEEEAGEAYKLAKELLKGGFEPTEIRREVKRKLTPPLTR